MGSFRAPFDADTVRRFLKHVYGINSARVHGSAELSSVTIVERVHADFGLPERERIALKRVLLLAFEVVVAAVACVGSILAIFAWTGAGL